MGGTEVIQSTGVRPKTKTHWLVKSLKKNTLNLDLSGPGRGWKINRTWDMKSLAECLDLTDLTMSGEYSNSSDFGIMS